MKLLLDTSFILELKRRNEKAISALRKAAEEAEDIAISVLTKYELMVGAYYLWFKNKNTSERKWLEEVLKWLTVADISERALERATEIKARGLADKISFPDMDLLIAVSLDPPAKLLTFDKDHKMMEPLLKRLGIEVEFFD